MFTDWTLTDPHYFYKRGILLGMVATTLFWKIGLPSLQGIIRNVAMQSKMKKEIKELIGKVKDHGQ